MPKFSACSMKRNLLFLLTFLALGSIWQPLTAQAQGTRGPSAIAAARLKNKPPKNWIRHYLGDDRYKIAGGVWKVVSTELDRYYYPAWAPEMLRQPAGIVIGFASAAQAEEAGYSPSAYGAGDALYGLTAAEIAAAKRRTASGGRIDGTRITLSDGISTVILPNGWTHILLKNPSTESGIIEYPIDVLTPRDGKTGIGFGFIKLPSNIKAESFLSPRTANQLSKQLPQDRYAELKGAKFISAKLGGLTGVTMIAGKDAKLPAGMSGNVTFVGRGPKIYLMSAQLPLTDKNYGVIVNSFQPR